MKEMENIDRRRVFMRLPERERDAALWNMLMDEISERVKLMARVIELENDNEYMRGELDGISHRREDTMPLNTDQKIQMALEKRGTTWAWYRDKVLASTLAAIQTAVVLAILYLTFGGKLP